MPTNIRDPRSIVTPDAFGIDERLLGLPLSGPGRRFWAMLVDLLVIGLLTLFLNSIQLFIWGVVALFLIRMAFQRRGSATQAAAVLMRVFAGCMGLIILTAVVIAFVVVRGASSGPPSVPRVTTPDVAGLEGLEAFGELRVFEDLHDAEDPDEAVSASADLLAVLMDEDDDEDDALQLLRLATPDDAPWEDAADSVYAAAVERWRERVSATAEPLEPGDEVEAGDAVSGGPAGEGDGTAEEAVAAAEAEVEAMSEGEVLVAYAALLQAEERSEDEADGEGSAAERARAGALRRRAVEVVAGDTLQRLEAGIDELADERAGLVRDLRRTRRELEEERSSFTALLRDIWDQAGSAIGLWSLYFTVLLTLWKGQTVGKRLMGIRVLRLDGQPMTWWTSFERGGGYVAGIATGLLGFAQLFWDPNRQCIHDKIVGTVVVTSGADAVPGAWRDAHGASRGEPRAKSDAESKPTWEPKGER